MPVFGPFTWMLQSWCDCCRLSARSVLDWCDSMDAALAIGSAGMVRPPLPEPPRPRRRVAANVIPFRLH